QEAGSGRVRVSVGVANQLPRSVLILRDMIVDMPQGRGTTRNGGRSRGEQVLKCRFAGAAGAVYSFECLVVRLARCFHIMGGAGLAVLLDGLIDRIDFIEGSGNSRDGKHRERSGSGEKRAT